MRRIVALALTVMVLAGCGGSKGLDPKVAAIGLYNDGDLDGATMQLTELARQRPEDPQVAYYLGRVAFDQQRFDDALQHFTKATELSANHADAHYWSGRTYAAQLNQTQDFQKMGALASSMVSSAQRAVEIDPAHLDARTLLGMFYLNAPPIAGGSVDKAKQQAALIMAEDEKRGRGFMAQILIKEGDIDGARAEYQTLIDKEPDNADLWYSLAMLHQGAEQWDEAFASFDKALAADADHVRSMYQIARTCLFADREYERGVTSLQTYLAKPVDGTAPSHANAYWRLGLLYQKQNRIADARAALAKAVAMDPEHQQAREALESLPEQ